VRGLAPLQPNLLVTLGSDAHFGADRAPQQHLAMAQFRSIEMRLDTVRAFYNGISAIIDANGRVQVQTRAVDPEALPGVRAFGLTGTVALLDGPRSFYARHGNVFAWLNLLLAFALMVAPPVLDWIRRRGPRRSEEGFG
jgi:apolipoprotein N-acyltransferase